MAIQPYIFDTSKGETPETVARQRMLAAQILGQYPGRITNLGEGIGSALFSIGNALQAGDINQKADAAQAAGQQQANTIQQQIYGWMTGGAPPPSAAPASSGPQMSSKPSQSEFVQQLWPSAVEASQATGIDPRIIVAQSAVETGWGKSAPGNNYFGIKSHGQPGGNVMATTEYEGGQPVRTQDSFRAYASPEDSVRGYTDFINQNPRYAAFKQAPDLDSQLNALGRSGYATDPNYATTVGQIARTLQVPTTQVASADPGFVPGQPGAGPASAPTSPASRPAQASGQAPVQVAQVPPRQPPEMPRSRDLTPLIQAATNPWVPPEMREMAKTMLQQEMQRQQQAADPMRQLQIQKLQQDLSGGAPTGDIREYEYARQQGFKGSFQDYQVMLREAGRPSTSVTIDQKAQGELEKTLAGGVGKTFTSMYDEGAAAGLDLYQIDRLRGLLAKSGSGLAPALTNVAAGFGIKLGDGADAGQAADAIISYLTPRMRIPGSGSSSDKDLAAFRRSLPALMNTPEGNNLILDTMQGLAEYKRAQGDIAGQVVMGEIQPQDAVKMIRALPDPFAQFKTAGQQQPGQSSDGWTTLPNGVRVRQKAQ